MNLFAIAVMALVLAAFAQPADSQYFVGSRGGCYLLTKSGNKRYVDRSMCATKTAVASGRGAAVSAAKPTAPAADSTSKYRMGARGGCYTITASGGKRYVDRGMCQ